MWKKKTLTDIFVEKRSEIIEALYDYVRSKPNKEVVIENPNEILRVSDDGDVISEFINKISLIDNNLVCEWYSDQEKFKDDIELLSLDEIYQILEDIDGSK